MQKKRAFCGGFVVERTITRMRAYHQYKVLHIIAIMDRVYHQIEAEGVLYTASAVMIYKHFVLDDMPNLATLRFG